MCHSEIEAIKGSHLIEIRQDFEKHQNEFNKVLNEKNLAYKE
jgi:hypothetical protein